jgi:pilus assembly protein CpaB
MDQAAENKDQKAVSDVKTVTLELSPEQARTMATAQAMGSLSLALRGLGDEQSAAADPQKKTNLATDGEDQSGIVTVIRYGLLRKSGGGGGVQ